MILVNANTIFGQILVRSIMLSALSSLSDNVVVQKIAIFIVAIRQKLLIGLYCLLSLYVFLILLSYSRTDPAWSHLTGFHHNDKASVITNIGGAFGAMMADLLYLFFGATSWLLLVFLTYEALRVYLRILEPKLLLRLFGYLVVWWCTAGVVFGLGDVLGGKSIDWGGVVGFELHYGLSVWIGQFGAIATNAMMMMMVIAWFLIEKPKLQVVESHVSIEEDLSEPTPVEEDGKQAQTAVKKSTPKGKGALKIFLQESGLQKELLQDSYRQSELDNKTNDDGIRQDDIQKDDMTAMTQQAKGMPDASLLDVFASQSPDGRTKIDGRQKMVGKIDDKQNDGRNDGMTDSAAASYPSSQAVHKPDIDDDQLFAHQSFAMRTAEHRASLLPLPAFDLLDKMPESKVAYTPIQLQQLSELLELKLQEFGIKATVVNAVQGPVVTRFEVDLAAGTKAAKVVGVSEDLARSLSMRTLRVVSIIPGKSYIGIEIPNNHVQIIKLIELVHSEEFRADIEIAMIMGKDISGKPVVTNLAKAPHMLVAGTTGSGKSVLINSLLLSMLLKYTPEQLRLILIDPKILEFAPYENIPHLLTPIVDDMSDATAALSWCVGEMERRYQLMALLRVRKLAEFNKKVAEAEAMGSPIFDPLWRPNDSVGKSSAPMLKPLPLITVVADEFADLIIQIGKPVEELITRLAQKSRAAGIHLILATQRPSTDVVTGLIKANIPVRVSLLLKTVIDSRTILDSGGAEKLLGNGDMLFIGPGQNEAERVHGAFVSDDEVNRICDAWRERGAPEYIDTVVNNNLTDFTSSQSEANTDPLYDEAVSFVLESGSTSISRLQRKLSIGFNRAANIIEAMQENGILSPPDSSGRRTIL